MIHIEGKSKFHEASKEADRRWQSLACFGGEPDGTGIGPENTANAILCAAAPDLLSALVMAKNWMDCDFDKKMSDHDQAINKATS